MTKRRFKVTAQYLGDTVERSAIVDADAPEVAAILAFTALLLPLDFLRSHDQREAIYWSPMRVRRRVDTKPDGTSVYVEGEQLLPQVIERGPEGYLVSWGDEDLVAIASTRWVQVEEVETTR
jgi:hypothetical protein